MFSVKVDFSKTAGKIKPMHATNNGPIKGIGFGGANTNGFEMWKNAGIPFVRTHDSSFCASYGGEHTVDVHAVFPNFDSDVNNPDSYDFAVTDNYLKQITDCGSKVFYRLGTKIEHEVKKYNTLPPKDFKKWAEIKLDFGDLKHQFEVFLLDKGHNCESVELVSSSGGIKLSPNTACLIKSI